MPPRNLYDRLLYPRLVERLNDAPTVLLHGPRQCGKTTLVQKVAKEQGMEYITFDDHFELEQAKFDPKGYIERSGDRVVFDEVQLVPELFRSIKASIDNNREPGRYILTGSSDVLQIPKLGDSLVGRMATLRLHPLAQAELEGNTSTNFLTQLFEHGIQQERGESASGEQLAERVAVGGYPETLKNSSNLRITKHNEYISTLIQRDVSEFARVRTPERLHQLLQLVAGHTSDMLNLSQLASQLGIKYQTMGEYITLLRNIFQVDRLPHWHASRMQGHVKRPKLHIGDTGLACSLLGVDAPTLWKERELLGKLLETFVYQELRRLASCYECPVDFYYFRTKEKKEVDMVLEARGKVAAIEVKAATTVHPRDFGVIRRLQEVSNIPFVGLVFYDGYSTVEFEKNLWAVPFHALWN